MSNHLCHARGCETEVPPKMFMCKKHWAILPKPIQNEVWLHYRPGQEIDKVVTKAYLKATAVAEFFVQYVGKGYPIPHVWASLESCKYNLTNTRRRLTGRAD